MSTKTGMKPTRIAIVGAGVSGLSVGVCLAETLPHGATDLMILAEKFTPDIVSHSAGAIFMPGGTYTGGVNEPFEKASRRWSRDTFHWLTKIHEAGEGGASGITQWPAYKVYTEVHGTLYYKDLLTDFKVLSPAETLAANLPPTLKTAWSFKTFVVDVTKYLPWLMQRFRDQGGVIVQRKVHSLSELSDYDIIVNCSGMDARELAGDLGVYPVRGQLVAVRAPWIRHICYHRELDLSHVAYMFPRGEEILLGGTAEPNVWSTEPDPATTDAIYRKCLELCPQLKGAEVVRSWACLRPVRETVRLEMVGATEDVPAAVVHNYGHGGQGYILSWGCAKEVIKLVQQCISEKQILHPVSKM